jgi:hypothetical protein
MSEELERERESKRWVELGGRKRKEMYKLFTVIWLTVTDFYGSLGAPKSLIVIWF